MQDLPRSAMTGPAPDPARGVYGIAVAAELVGIDPQSLRLYERRGLLEPARTDGGTRRYSSDDIDRLRRNTALLPPAPPAPARAPPPKAATTSTDFAGSPTCSPPASTSPASPASSTSKPTTP